MLVMTAATEPRLAELVDEGFGVAVLLNVVSASVRKWMLGEDSKVVADEVKFTAILDLELERVGPVDKLAEPLPLDVLES